MSRPVLEEKKGNCCYGIQTLNTFARILQTGPELLLEFGAVYLLPQPPRKTPNLLPTHLNPIYIPKTVLGWMEELARRPLPIGPQAG